MNFSLFRRKKKNLVPISVLKELYYDYTRNKSTKQRIVKNEIDFSSPQRNHTKEFSEIINNKSITRKRVTNSQEGKGQGSKRSQQNKQNKNYFKDHFSTSHPLFKPHPQIKKVQVQGREQYSQRMNFPWKLSLNKTQGLKTPLEFRKQVQVLRKRQIDLNRDRSEKSKLVRRNFLIQKCHKFQPLSPNTPARMLLKSKIVHSQTKQNIFPSP